MSTHSSLPNALKQDDSAPEENLYSVTFVIITKDRPRLIQRLLRSIIETELESFSLVLIDDSGSHNFLQIRNLLQSLAVPFKQLSSSQAGGVMEKALRKSTLTPWEKDFIRNCVGLSSPFRGYVERFLRLDRPNSALSTDCLWFAPYSPARNLGMCCAVNFFNPDIIALMDDDCLILFPEKLRSQLELIGTQLHQRYIVAVSGLYKDLSVLPHFERRIFKKAFRILRGMDAFLRKSFEIGKARFETMPPHMLGGTLILSKRIFCTLPFDPYVARGEDHAYALDLRWFLKREEVALRDNDFVVGHLRQGVSEKSEDVNVLRDIFRFVYVRAKTGYSFIPFFVVRWGLATLISLSFNPSVYVQRKNELCALLFDAPRFAKENSSKFRQSTKAWKRFFQQLSC